MKVDRYTKIVLTIIAICLVYQQVQPHILPRAALAADTMDVRIVDSYVPLDTNLASVGGHTILRSGRGKHFGVRGADQSIVPIHWGEVSVGP
jgi:hypothetical protein